MLPRTLHTSHVTPVLHCIRSTRTRAYKGNTGDTTRCILHHTTPHVVVRYYYAYTCSPTCNLGYGITTTSRHANSTLNTCDATPRYSTTPITTAVHTLRVLLHYTITSTTSTQCAYHSTPNTLHHILPLQRILLRCYHLLLLTCYLHYTCRMSYYMYSPPVVTPLDTTSTSLVHCSVSLHQRCYTPASLV